MGVTNANKQINVQQIDCNGTLQVTLALAAAPDITENPTDMVLLLDRSGSMAGVPLENLKLGANAFIDIIDQATDGSKDGHIGGGSRIGIVSFSDTATTVDQETSDRMCDEYLRWYDCSVKVSGATKDTKITFTGVGRHFFDDIVITKD